MRKLFLLLLIFPAKAMAESETFGFVEHAVQKYQHSLESFSKFGKPEDYKMACTELRMACTVMKNKLDQLKSHKPQHNWLQTKETVKEIIEGGCEPYRL